jgi:hypothetical protein
MQDKNLRDSTYRVTVNENISLPDLQTLIMILLMKSKLGAMPASATGKANQQQTSCDE